MDLPGISRRRHRGVFLGVAVFVIVLTAITWLVYDRFGAASHQFGALQVVSPFPMACVFGGVLLVDMCSRLFLASEPHEQYHQMIREFEGSNGNSCAPTGSAPRRGSRCGIGCSCAVGRWVGSGRSGSG